MVANIINVCEDEAKAQSLTVPLTKPRHRAANYAGVSVRTIATIKKEKKIAGDNPLKSPGKHRKYDEKRKMNVDDFDRAVIKRIIENFYLVQKTVPTIKKLLPVLRSDIGFQWSATSLRRLLLAMGFRFRQCANKRVALIEKTEIVFWRVRYLRSIRKFREEGRPIFFLDETWADSNLTHRRCWQNEDVRGVLTSTSGSHRFIITHIGSKDGFLPECSLVFKAGQTSGDYHGQMNAENFERWMETTVVPKLPANSIIVMDNAPYHSKILDKPPSKNALKKDMMEWLQRKGIACDMSLRKVELHDLIKTHSPPQKQYRVDQKLRLSGHTVLRLPPYMCELNPIELVWAQIKKYVRDRNTTGDMSQAHLKELIDEAINSITPEFWKRCVEKIISIEEEYWERDAALDVTVDELIIRVSDSSSEESDNYEESDESDFDDPTELAMPVE